MDVSAIYINDLEQSLSTFVTINANDPVVNLKVHSAIQTQTLKCLGYCTIDFVGTEWTLLPMIRRDLHSCDSDIHFEVSSTVRIADGLAECVYRKAPLPILAKQRKIPEDKVQVQVYLDIASKILEKSFTGSFEKLHGKARDVIYEELKPFCLDLPKKELVVQEKVLQTFFPVHPMTIKEALEQGLIFVLARAKGVDYSGKRVTYAACKTLPNASESAKPKRKASKEHKPTTMSNLLTNDNSKRDSTSKDRANEEVGLKDILDALVSGFQQLNTSVNTKLDNVAAQLTSTNTKLDNVATQLNKSNTKLDDVATQLNKSNTRLTQIENQIQETNKLAAANYGKVYEKVHYHDLNTMLHKCKWVLDFSLFRSRLLSFDTKVLSDQLMTTKYNDLLSTLSDTEQKKLTADTPTVETDTMCIIQPALHNVNGRFIPAFHQNEKVVAALKRWEPDCPEQSCVLLLGETTARAMGSKWRPKKDYKNFEDVIDSIKSYKESGDDEQIQLAALKNFIYKMLQMERMVTAWRVKLLVDGNLFPLDNILLVMQCNSLPKKAHINAIKDAVPSVHKLYEAEQLIFVRSEESMYRVFTAKK